MLTSRAHTHPSNSPRVVGSCTNPAASEVLAVFAALTVLGAGCASGEPPDPADEAAQLPPLNWTTAYPGGDGESAAAGNWGVVLGQPSRALRAGERVRETLPLASCEADEKAFFGGCYSVVASAEMTYQVARQRCADRRAQLVTVDSASVNAFVLNLLPSDGAAAWIGLCRESGAFAWESGEPLGYANWSPGAPTASDQGCVVMWGAGIVSDSSWHGRWSDGPCEVGRDLAVCVRQ